MIYYRIALNADWWKPQKNSVCKTRYKHDEFLACRVDFTGMYIKNMNKRSL